MSESNFKKKKKGRNVARGKREEGRKVKEEGHRQVKKDETCWTVVARNEKQRKMIQILVTVDESKVTPIEVSETNDKSR